MKTPSNGRHRGSTLLKCWVIFQRTKTLSSSLSKKCSGKGSKSSLYRFINTLKYICILKKFNQVSKECFCFGLFWCRTTVQNNRQTKTKVSSFFKGSMLFCNISHCWSWRLMDCWNQEQKGENGQTSNWQGFAAAEPPSLKAQPPPERSARHISPPV